MKRKRRGPGRPALPASQKCSEIVCVKLTKGEIRELRRLAGELRVTMSALVKGKLFKRRLVR